MDAIPLKKLPLLWIGYEHVQSIKPKAWVIGAHCHLASGVGFILHNSLLVVHAMANPIIVGRLVNWSSYKLWILGEHQDTLQAKTEETLDNQVVQVKDVRKNPLDLSQ